MKYQTLKNRIITHKKPLLFIISSWFATVLFFIFIPYLFVNLALGVIFMGITLHYVKTNKNKKKSTFAMLSLITVIFFGSFIALFVSYNQSATTLNIYDGGIEFTENVHFFGGEIWYFDHNLQGEQGQVDLSKKLEIPSKTELYHYTPDRPSGFTYFIEVKTQLKLDGDQINLKVWGIDELEPNNPERTIIFDDYITVDDTYLDLTGYSYGGNYTLDGTVDYSYYLFYLEGYLYQDQEPASSLITSYLKIEPSETIEGDEWGFTESSFLTQKEILDIALSPMGQIFLIGISILVAFLVIFLITIITGAIEQVKYFLIIITLVSVLVLFVMMAMSTQIPVVKAIIDVCEAIPDPFGVFEALANIVKIIAFVVAFVVWSFAIGTFVCLCWALWYIWTRFIGDFIGETFDFVEFKEG